MNSKIYFGRVQHRRFSPKPHEFSYGMFMLYLDLDELPTLFERFWLWSRNRWNIASFFDNDYLCENKQSIRETIANKIKTEFDQTPTGPIRMLTHLRYFGHCFNPVTFYYCFNADGEKVDFVVAEINNTPWNQRHCYLLDNRLNTTNSVESYFAKDFHVSPFLPMDMLYRWRFSSPEENLSVVMQNFKGNDKVFDATLLLKAKDINSSSLARALIQYPLMSWQVSFGIYWQAFRLWLKKTPFFSNPSQVDDTNLSSQIEK